MSTNKKDEELRQAPTGFLGSATGVGVNNSNQAAIREQMNQNSKAWWEADDTGRAELEAANRLLASKLGDGVKFDAGTGVWSGQADQGAAFDFAAPQPSYESSYSQRIDDMLNKIMNREPFRYDYNADPLYAQYADAYTRNGQRAMQDTLGQVSARTGGLASSYAGTAAQDSYNQYMSALNDKIPELQQLAYEMWMDGNNMDYKDMDLLMGMDDREYNRYQDALNNWHADRDFAYGVYGDEQALAGDRADMMASIGDFSGYKALGFTDEEIAKLQAYWQAQQMPKSSGGSGRGNGGDEETTETGYDALFEAALESGYPQSFIANNYKNYGFTSSTGLYNEFKDWNAGVEAERADGMNPSHFNASASAIMAQVSQGLYDNALAQVDNIWGQLNDDQRESLQAALKKYQIEYEA